MKRIKIEKLNIDIPAFPRLTPDKDKRFKIKPSWIKEMQRLVASGLSYSAIGRKYNVHYNTVRYYTIPNYQQEQKKKNARHKRPNTKRRTELLMENRRLKPTFRKYQTAMTRKNYHDKRPNSIYYKFIK